jgi:pyruvate/2-oxoacid:ferredoxin oxidoreductase beta subunit
VSVLLCLQGISDGMSCAVNEARMAVDVGYWPLYRYTPETDLPVTTDEVSDNTAGSKRCHSVWVSVLAYKPCVRMCL